MISLRQRAVDDAPVVFGPSKDDPVPQLIDAFRAAASERLAGQPKSELPTDRLDQRPRGANTLGGEFLLILDQFESTSST